MESDLTLIQITAADFAQLPESNQLRELIDGELIVPASPSDDHQDVVLSTASYIKTLIKTGKIKIAPQDLYLDELNVPQPDIFWAGNTGGACQLNDRQHWEGAPDLVIEVLSPSTGYIDRGKKYRLYERHGVREYWLIDPLEKFVEVYILTNSKFIRQDLYEKNATFTSPVLENQTIVVSQLFAL
jgi:Uma2 family endonuclease